MLLDDVMSELDAERRELLVAELAGGGQSVLATTDLAHVPQSSGPVAQLRVEPGRVLQEELAA
jgi:recombinational DNA repair ATPase RecF